MPAIANAAYFPNGTIMIGADEYKAAIDSAVLTPTTPVTPFLDIGGGVSHASGTPVWSLALSLAQDLKTANSLSQYLITNAGTKKTIVFTPQAGGKGFTVSALIVPAPVGGAGGAVAKATVTLMIDGQPTIA